MMAKKKNTKIPDSISAEMRNINDRVSEHIRQAQESYRKGEDLLIEAWARAKGSKNPELKEFILQEAAALFSMAGWRQAAKDVLAQSEKVHPKSLNARLRTANFLFLHGGDYPNTLRKLSEIKLSAKPEKLDYDVYYSALALKGRSLLALNKERQAVGVMKEFARFTATHLDKTIFFRDLHFVTEMVNRRLGLRHCRAYLEILDGIEQVAHDAIDTKTLLKKMKGLRGSK